MYIPISIYLSICLSVYLPTKKNISNYIEKSKFILTVTKILNLEGKEKPWLLQNCSSSLVESLVDIYPTDSNLAVIQLARIGIFISFPIEQQTQ